MGDFAVTIVARPEIVCAGIMIKTTMARASVDCMALWRSFGPRMCSVPANPEYPEQSFGASMMTSETEFDYWALMPLAPGAEAPEGMEKFTLPAGEYVECPVKSLEEMGPAYNYIYMEWPKTQEKYRFEMGGIGYEKYKSDFMETGELVLYCPLVAK